MSAQTVSAIEGPRTRGKRDAVRDFDGATSADVDALIQDAQSRYRASNGDAAKYWLAYWGRLLQMRREAYQRRHSAGRHLVVVR